MKVTAKIGTFSIRIYIDGIVHVALQRNSLVGFQAWKERDGEFWIEYRFKSGQSLKAMYDTAEKSKAVLKVLDVDELFTYE